MPDVVFNISLSALVVKLLELVSMELGVEAVAKLLSVADVVLAVVVSSTSSSVNIVGLGWVVASVE